MKLLLFILIGFTSSIFSQSGNLVLNKDSLLLQNSKKLESYEKLTSSRENSLALKEAYVARGIIYCNEFDQYDSALLYFNKALENNWKVVGLIPTAVNLMIAIINPSKIKIL